MFRRYGRKDAVADAAESMARYATDRELRERLLRVTAAAIAARERAAHEFNRATTLARLARDPVLRRQLSEMATQMKKAQERAQRKRSRKLRTSLLALVGIGAAGAALVPSSRRWIVGRISGEPMSNAQQNASQGSVLKSIVEEIEVAVPVSTAYNQWTQFEEFPKFMEGVEDVRQIDDTLFHWATKVAGKHAEWDARIVEQQPDRRIVWESIDGTYTSGSVSFEPVGPERSRIHLQMRYRTDGVLEATGSGVGLDARRVRGDLQRFRELVEGHGFEAGAWRGEIHEGTATDEGTPAPTR